MTSAAMPVTAAPAPTARRLTVPEGFLLLEIACQLALLVPGLNAGALRVVWRVGGFAASLLLLGLLRGKTRRNNANVAALWVIAILVLEIFHPLSNTWASRVAEVGMSVAILAPLYWMTRAHFDLRGFRRLLHLFWGYYTLSTLVGLAQAYFPGRFQTNLSPIVAQLGAIAQGLKIAVANGQYIYRPMGLTDIPGGAATAGLWAVLFGLGFLLTAAGGRMLAVRRIVYLASMMAGMMVIYLSEERALLVVLAVWFAVLLAFMLWRQRWREFSVLLGLVLLLALGSLRLAAPIGGTGMMQRLETLHGSHAEQVYEQERGGFLRQTFETFIPEYPLGAGLGRWGMMNTYFGNNRNPQTGTIYVEIQWQGWVLDGGVPLLAAYLLLLGLTLAGLYRLARQRGPLWLWATLTIAYDIGILALTFDYTPFTGQMGMEFWFLNALVLAAGAALQRPAPRRMGS